MTEIQVEVEVQRVRNVVEAFGWKMSKQERLDNKVILTLEMEIASVEVEADKGAS